MASSVADNRIGGDPYELEYRYSQLCYSTTSNLVRLVTLPPVYVMRNIPEGSQFLLRFHSPHCHGLHLGFLLVSSSMTNDKIYKKRKENDAHSYKLFGG